MAEYQAADVELRNPYKQLTMHLSAAFTVASLIALVLLRAPGNTKSV